MEGVGALTSVLLKGQLYYVGREWKRLQKGTPAFLFSVGDYFGKENSLAYYFLICYS